MLKMLATYLSRFHPVLAPQGCKMLFPSRDGGHKRSAVLSHQISELLRRRCDIKMNAHLFRHLAAKIYLDVFPGQYGVIRMLLGPKSIDTTIKAYFGMEFSAAYACYDKLITRLRSEDRPIVERGPARASWA
jgi:integrase